MTKVGKLARKGAVGESVPCVGPRDGSRRRFETFLKLLRAAVANEGSNRELEELIQRFQELCRLPDDERAARHLEIADADPRLAVRLADLFEAAAGAAGSWTDELSRARRLFRGLAAARERARGSGSEGS